MWEYQALALGKAGFRVVTYDRRGFGRSSQPGDGYDYDTLTADLATLIEALQLRDVGLVGFSMGGGEVVRYLARYGNHKRVQQAVLVSAVTPFMSQREDNPKGVSAEVFQKMTQQILDDRPKFLAGFSKTFYGVGALSSPVSDERLQTDLQVAMQASLKATLDCANSFATTDFRGDLPALAQVPTLVIHGTEDKTVPIDATGRAVKAAVPSVVLKEYEGQPHGLFVTDKDRLNRDLLAFLGGR